MSCTGLRTEGTIMNQKIDKVTHEIYSLVKEMDIKQIITSVYVIYFNFKRLYEQSYMVLLKTLMGGLTWKVGRRLKPV